METTAQQFIALVDCNNFFVSCERLFRPDLATRPVVVLSSNDGCVISRSEEAKTLGIAMGEPYFTVRELCELHSVGVFSSNFDLYRDLSRRVMYTLRRLVSDIEVYSIDEAFLEFGVLTPSAAHTLAARVRDEVAHEVGIPVSVGVATTKTLAKAASHFAKEAARGRSPRFLSALNERSSGTCVLYGEELLHTALRELPVNEVWGVGRRLGPVLAGRGILTAHDLTLHDDRWIRSRMSVRMLRTVYELRGVRCFPLGEEADVRQSLLHSRSFGSGVADENELRSAVAHHARKVAEILRAEQVCAREVGVLIRSSRYGARTYAAFDTDMLDAHTNDTLAMVRASLNVFERLYRAGISYAKAGVLVRDIVPEKAVQPRTLFGERTDVRAPLMHALDQIRRRMGDVVRLGVEQTPGLWHARHTLLSPRYTTRWDDVPRVHAKGVW